jgi:diaminobutyrate-2-oxoglutarate transaminase
MDFSKLSFSDAPLIKTVPPGPKSKELIEFQLSHEGSSVNYPKSMPMALLRGKGATVEDVDGNLYIDFLGGAAVINVGHSNPEVIEAAAKQLYEITHSLDITNPTRNAFVKTLFSILPEPLTRVYFGGPTGSDAVESAMKLAKFNTKRAPMISFEGSYHGMSAGALSLSSTLGTKEDFLPMVPEVHFVPYAYCYRCAFGKEPQTCALECAKYLDHVLDDPHSGVGKPAAVIVEAVQGEGGSIVAPEKFMQEIRRICTQHEVLLIVDEIQAGLCRTGKMFAFEHSGIVPDIITMSKALGGLGFPISCIAYKEILDTWPSGKHLGTFRGNLIAYAAGHSALNFMLKTNLAQHVLDLGSLMLSWLQEIEKESRIVGDVRGKGLMLGIEFVKDKTTKEPAPELTRRVSEFCYRHGLLVEVSGHYSNVIRFIPPLILTEELSLKGIEIFENAIREAEK